MKKIISVLLSVLMLVTVTMPVINVSAANAQATPIIYIRGNGIHLYNENGERIASEIGDIELGSEDENMKDKIVETSANILLPFITEGLLFDKWDNYAQALYDEFSPLMDQVTLDGDGNPRYGTGPDKAELKKDEADSHKDYQMSNGKYDTRSYVFIYDWRLDPFETADRLDKYIDNILAATKKSQVSVVTRCMGGCVITAYLERYGAEGKVKNVLYGDTLAMGCAAISNGFSGKVEFDAKIVERYEGQLTHCAEIDSGVGFEIPVLADEIIQRSLDLFNQIGVTDKLLGSVEQLYSKLYKALIPALFHAFGFTSMPMYWALVDEEDFDEAFEIMFGEEGSEAREYYAGLIEKIEYYREHITSKRNDVFKSFSESYGVHIGSVSKYGYLNAPVIEDADVLSDALANLDDASLGATTAKIGSTLSDEYIASRIAENPENAKYISPDKMVDTSTSLYPDTAWVVKNQHHGFDDVIFGVAYEFCNGTGVTVEDSSYPRFMMYDDSTLTWSEMTEDNCGDLEFMTRPTEKSTIATKLAAFFKWLTKIFELITKLFNGEIGSGK